VESRRRGDENAQIAHVGQPRQQALAACKDFLALWKDADLPILKEAKAQYAKLQ
jgi:hypothetical protein